MSEYYTTREAAKLLGASPASVLKWRKDGLLEAYSHGEKGSKSKFYFKAEDLERLKRERQEPKDLPPLRKVGTSKETA